VAVVARLKLVRNGHETTAEGAGCDHHSEADLDTSEKKEEGDLCDSHPRLCSLDHVSVSKKGRLSYKRIDLKSRIYMIRS
jgi:hypothetical protein